MEQDNQQVAQYKAEIRKGIEGLDLSNEEIKQLDAMFTYVIQNPDQYAQVVQQAIQSGALEEGDLPEEYDAQLIAAILGVLKEMEARNNEAGYKHGGLASAAKKLAAKGRGGDTMLAHINPVEAHMLKQVGGSGTVNPATGLPEFGFFKKIGKALKGVVKVAKGIVKSPIFQIGLSLAFPELAPMIGESFGLAGAAASAAGQAVIGGGMAALSGGNILKGAALGGIGGYAGAGGFGDMLPAGVTSGLSATTKGLLNAGISGGLAGAVTGQGALKGALTAGLTSAGTNLLKGYQPAADFLKGEGTLNKIANSALQGAGSAANIGGSPLAGAAMGTMGGAANIALQNMNFTNPTVQQALQPTAQEGINNRLLQPINYSPLQQTPVPPADVAPQAQNGVGGIDINQMTPNQLNSPMTSDPVQGQPLGGIDFSKVQGQAPGVQTGQGTATPISFNTGAPTTPTSFLGHLSNAAGGMSGSDMLKYGGIGLAGMGMLGGKKIPTTAQQEGHPDQRKLMNMIGGMDPQQRQYLESTNQLGTWLAQNWGNVTGGEYAAPANVPVGKANGGILSMLARGGGSGRDDTIEARLSDGEYVIDAETVAMLGDGSTDEGASRLDHMRQQIRMHKGKNLSKGKISPNAKSPLAYLGSR